MEYSLPTVFWSFVFRTAQAGLEAAPTYLCGLFIAAVFGRMLGPAGVYRLFGGNRPAGLLRAWIIGMLLPVCSIGAFPVMRELRRSGLSGGTVLAFGLSAPLFNPLSFLYGLTLAEPSTILAFSFFSLLIVAGVGLAWDHVNPARALATAEHRRVPHGMRRMTAVAVDAAREAIGPSTAYAAIALLGVGMMAATLPAGALQNSMSHSDWTSPLLMSAVATPAFVSPTKAMMQIGLMFDHGNSIGAAFALLILGAGVNAGTLAWSGRTWGAVRTATWLAMAAGAVLVIAWFSESTMYDAPRVEAHTHAFDEFCSPYRPDSRIDYADDMKHRLKDKAQLHELASLYCLCGLGVIGGILALVDRRNRLEIWLSRDFGIARVGPGWDVVVPGHILAGLAVVGLIVFSVVGCYVYYPPAGSVLEDIRIVRANALTAVLSGNGEEAMRDIRRWDDLSRKLEVGVFLRAWKLDPDAHERAESLREALEQVHDAIMAGRIEEAKSLVPAVNDAHHAFRRAFGSPAPRISANAD